MEKLTKRGSKELVTLRRRETKGGGYTLYLDYSIGRVRHRDFLKMYLIPERTKLDRIQNQETMKAALAAKARLVIDIQNGEAGLRKHKKDLPLIEYVQLLRDKYESTNHTGCALTMMKISRHLEKYPHKTSLQTADKDFIVGFLDYLKKDLAEGTVFTYFAGLATIFNRAYKDELIRINPFSKIDKSILPKRKESIREYLTLDEVKALADTQCLNESVKRAFLFSCFTGLRISDVERLLWSDIIRTNDGYQIERKQKKTGTPVYVPLSENAMRWMPPKGKSNVVFYSLPKRAELGRRLKIWTADAGITKHITFHCARHTYATLLLTYGAEIYTVSKLLGHADVATTQIYAKIVDEKKREAVNLIPKIG